MNLNEKLDIKENEIYKLDPALLDILLIDRTTNKNIIWATDMYENRGIGFEHTSQITPYLITGKYGNVIKPRTEKTKKEIDYRVKDKAEVFTPSWICNKQNNMIDNEWFGKNDIFNVENGNKWKTTDRIEFPAGKKWQDYVVSQRLEISCGEAPYLVSRYDTVSGKIISIKNRIGMLDRKFRVLNENVNVLEEWIEWSKKIMKSVYGYDWQGDNVLLARENLLYTYIDNYVYKFSKNPPIELLIEIATIISWNIIQMDGINFIVPYSCKNEKIVEMTLFGDKETIIKCEGCINGKINKHNGLYCTIMNWNTNKKVKFISVLKRGK